MSDPNNTQPVQPLSTKTGAVPLKKETVRITLRARPGAGLTQKQPTLAQGATAPVSLQSTAPVQLPLSDATSKLPLAPANKATASIQLPSAPLPPPAARAATAPVSLQSTSPVQLPAPSAQPASRSTAVVKLDPATAPVATIGAPPAPAAPRPAAPGAPRPMGAPPAPAMGAPRPPGAPPAPAAPRPVAGGAPRPPGAPPAPGPLSPTVPMAKAPGAPPAPGAPRPPGAPAAPRPPGAPAPVAAPPAGGAKVEAGAATVPLAKGPGAPPAKPGAAPGAKPPGAAAAGGTTSQLPKATVQLNKVGPAAGGAAGAAAAKPNAQANVPVKRPVPAAEDSPLYEEKDPEAGLMPLAVVCSILGVAILVLSLFGSDKFFYSDPGETSALKVPPPILPKWEQPAGDGTYVSSFNKELEAISSKFQ